MRTKKLPRVDSPPDASQAMAIMQRLIADGTPNLDCLDRDDLDDFRRGCRVVARMLDHLADIAVWMSSARAYRSAGQIEHALLLEQRIDDVVSRLPAQWRW